MGRLNPFQWISEGLPHLTTVHLLWWGLGLLAGILGGSANRLSPFVFLGIMSLFCLSFMSFSLAQSNQNRLVTSKIEEASGFQIEQQGPTADGTIVYFLTFDFQKHSQLKIGLYDCDSDDAQPYDDSNTTYMGQSLEALVTMLNHRSNSIHRQLLSVINGGFFGASGFSVAHHEEPVVQDEHAFYNVDLLRPKDQGWFFAINSSTSITSGHPRFSMLPSIPWNKLSDYQTVLGGVRPLRFDGVAIPLKPGAGSTALRCSRELPHWLSVSPMAANFTFSLFEILMAKLPAKFNDT